MPNDKDLIFELAQDNFETRQDFDKLLSEKDGADIVFSMVEDQFESRDVFDKMLADQPTELPGKQSPDFTMGNLVGRKPSPKPQPQQQPKKPYSPSAEKSLDSKLGFGSVIETVGKPNELTQKASAFSQYEQDQGYFAKVDEFKRKVVDGEDPSFTVPYGDEGMRILTDATGGGYTNVKRKANTARVKMMNEVTPLLDSEFNLNNSPRYVVKNEDGFDVPNVEAIDQYAKTLANKYGLPEDGYFKEVVYNEAKARASFLAIQPKVNEKFEQYAKPIKEQFNKQFEEGFTTDEVELQKLNSQVKDLSERLKSEADKEVAPLQQGVQMQVSEIDAQWKQFEEQTMAQAEQINASVQQGMPQDQAQAQLAQLDQQYKAAYDDYLAERSSTFDVYMRESNGIYGKYNQRLNRQAEELESVAKGRVLKAATAYEKEFSKDPELKNKLEEAYKRAYKETVAEVDKDIEQYNKSKLTSGIMPSWMGGSYAAGLAERFGRSYTQALGSSIKALGTTFESNAMQLWGDQLELRYSLPQAKTENFSDLLDGENFVQLTGQLAGGMTTSLIASGVTALATKNAPLTMRLAITGFAGWASETADITGRAYDDMFSRTQDAAQAQEAFDKSLDTQVKLMPLYAFEGLPFIGNALSKMSLIPRVIAGGAIETITEFAQELPQGIAEENISKGRDPFEDFYDLATSPSRPGSETPRWKETLITISPVAVLGGAGQLKAKELTEQEQIDKVASEYAASINVGSIIQNSSQQWVSSMVANQGENFAAATINTLFAQGQIDEAMRDKLTASIESSTKNFASAESFGLDKGRALVYDALISEHNELKAKEAELKANGDEVGSKIWADKASLLEKKIDAFIGAGASDFFTVTSKNGNQLVFSDVSKLSSPSFVAAIKASGATIEAYSEDGAARLRELNQTAVNNAKPREVVSEVKPKEEVAPLTNQASNTEQTGVQGEANPLADVESTAKALEGIELDPLFEKTKSTKYFRGQPTEDLPQKDIFISPNEIIGKMYAKGKGVLKNLALKASNLFDIDTTVTKEFNDKLIDAWKKANPKSAIIPKEILNGTHIGKGYSQVLKETPEFRRALEEMGFDGLLNNFSHLQLKLPRQEVIVFDKANVSEINADLISEAYHKAKADGSNPELVQAVEQLLTPQQDATKTGEIEQGSQQQREGAAGSQQGQQANRNNQEEDVAPSQAETGGSNSTQQSGAQQEEIKQAAKKAANAVRTLKAARPGYLQSSIGSVVWDAAVETVATAIEAGGNIAQAVADAIEQIKQSDFYKNLSKEDQDRVVSDFESSVNGSVSPDEAMALSGTPSGGSGGTGRRTPPSDKQKENNRTRVRNIMERWARNREIKFQDFKGAEAIRRLGTYTQVSMDEANTIADALIDDVGIEAAMDISMDPEFAGNVRTAILGRNLNQLADKARKKNTPENVTNLANAIIEFSIYGTNLGQALSQIRDVIESNPELFFAESLRTKSSSINNPTMGDPTTTGTRAQVGLSARDAVEAAREAAFDEIMSALTNPLTPEEAMRQALEKAFELSGNDRAVLADMLKDLRDRGLLASVENKDIAVAAVYDALNGLNNQLENPLADADIRQIAETLINTYEEIAKAKIKTEIDKILNTEAKRKGMRNEDKAIRALLYGALDDADYLEKWSMMFGGVSSAAFTAEEKAELKRLSRLYAQTKKQQGPNALATNSVNAQFKAYMNKVFVRQMAPGRKFRNRFIQAANLISGLRYNWILTAPTTLARVFSGTVESATTELASSMLADIVQGRPVAAKDAITKSFGNKQVVFTNAAGQQQAVELNRVLDNIYASIRGMPKMKAGGGQVFTEIEQLIRTNPKRATRVLLRALGVSAGRSMTAIDQLIIPITQYYTKSQVMYEIVKELYVQAGQDVKDPLVRAKITNDLESIMNGTPDQWGDALAQAQKDIMMGDLYKRSGLTAFPTTDPRKTKGVLSVEAKVYSEWLQRAYEIMDSKEAERLNKIATDGGWIGTMNPTQEMMALNAYLNAVTNSLTYTGLPRGTAGYLTDVVAKLAEKAPALQWAGVLPLFVNASGNFVAWTITNTPGINAIQLAKYYATGSRGAYRLKGSSEKELSQPGAVKVDQGKMAARVAITNAIFVATLLVNRALRGDDDDEREKFQESIMNGTYTGYTPVRLHPAFEAKGYKGGWFYYKGKPIFAYKDGGLAPFFNAVAFIDNYDKFTPPGVVGFGKDVQPFREESPEFAEAIFEYSLLVGRTAMDQSMLVEFSKTIDDVNKILVAEEGTYSDKAVKSMTNAFAKFTRSYIPYSRLQENIKSEVRENKPDPITFNQRVAAGTFLEQWAESSEKVDWFGRPIKSQMNYVSPFNLVSGAMNLATEDNKAIKDDALIDLFLSKNYAPTNYPQQFVPLMVDQEDLDSKDLVSFADRLEQSPEFKAGRIGQIKLEAENVDASGKPTYDKLPFTLFLEPDEVKKVNTQKSVIAGDFIQRNIGKFRNLPDDVFADIMNQAYNIANKVAISKQIPQVLKYMPDYETSIENSIRNFEAKYPNVGFEWPSKYK